MVPLYLETKEDLMNKILNWPVDPSTVLRLRNRGGVYNTKLTVPHTGPETLKKTLKGYTKINVVSTSCFWVTESWDWCLLSGPFEIFVASDSEHGSLRLNLPGPTSDTWNFQGVN